MNCYSNEKAEVCRRCHLPIVPLEDGEQQVNNFVVGQFVYLTQKLNSLVQDKLLQHSSRFQIVRTETGSAYHSDCYNCVRCHISLLGKPAYSMEDEVGCNVEEMFLCEKNTSKVVCATCRYDLVDERVRRQTAIEKAKAIEI